MTGNRSRRIEVDGGRAQPVTGGRGDGRPGAVRHRAGFTAETREAS
jgi:hypothetical protein